MKTYENRNKEAVAGVVEEVQKSYKRIDETPRTEAVILSDKGDSGFIRDLAVLSRQLERELNEAKAEVERLRTNLRRAVEIAEEIETLPHQKADNTTNAMKKYWELRAELDLLKATLNHDKK